MNTFVLAKFPIHNGEVNPIRLKNKILEYEMQSGSNKLDDRDYDIA